MRLVPRLLVILCLALWLGGCATGPQPGVAGPYSTWDDVINRWIGKNKTDLYYELGPPNLHPKELEDGTTEMVWDMTIDRMPGQADEYHLLPLYGQNVNCRLMFLADPNGIITKGRRDGCD
jgi:hypothetical protein